jgi:lipoate-protein ligase A
MEFLDLTLGTMPENLALDDALLLQAEAGHGGEVLRTWEWPRPAVVLGAGGRLAQDVDEAACQADNVPILRRSSGGGTVLLGAGCLLYSLVLEYDRAAALAEIRSSYCYIFDRIRASLADAVPGIECAGTSDLALAGRKFSGNAQQRKRRHLLHHGSLLYAFDLKQVGRYLRAPARQPEYRRGRDHAAFLMNLPLDAEEIKRRLRNVWQVETTADVPADLVHELTTTKYSHDGWTRRRE